MLYLEEGSEREQCCLLGSWLAFSHFPATHKQIGPFWSWFPGGWVCVHSRTLWVSPVNSLWDWEFLPPFRTVQFSVSSGYFLLLNLLLSLFWLCEEAKCTCLHLHLGCKCRDEFTRNFLEVTAIVGLISSPHIQRRPKAVSASKAGVGPSYQTFRANGAYSICTAEKWEGSRGSQERYEKDSIFECTPQYTHWSLRREFKSHCFEVFGHNI